MDELNKVGKFLSVTLKGVLVTGFDGIRIYLPNKIISIYQYLLDDLGWRTAIKIAKKVLVFGKEFYPFRENVDFSHHYYYGTELFDPELEQPLLLDFDYYFDEENSPSFDCLNGVLTIEAHAKLTAKEILRLLFKFI